MFSSRVVVAGHQAVGRACSATRMQLPRRWMAKKTRAELRKAAEADAKAGTYWKYAGVATVLGGIGGIAVLGAPAEVDDVVEDLYKDENPVMAYLYRAKDAVSLTQDKYVGFNPNLLPARKSPENYLNDFVLVLDMERTLTYTEWTPETGNRTMIRPGMYFFLDWAKQACGEVVIWSEKDIMDSQMLVQKLQEKSGFFLYQGHALFSNDLRPVELPDGTVQKVKDLSVLNRDLSKVIVVDDDAQSIQMCKDNAIRITPWEGDPSDTSLVDLVSLLQALMNVNKDVRGIVPRYAECSDAGKAFMQAAMATAQTPQQSPTQGLAQSPPGQVADQGAPVASSDSWSVLGVKLW